MGRHQCILIKLLRPRIGREAVISVAAVGDVDRSAEIAEQRSAPKLPIRIDCCNQRTTLHLRRGRHPESVEKRWSEIDRLREHRLPTARAMYLSRVMNEERDMY